MMILRVILIKYEGVYGGVKRSDEIKYGKARLVIEGYYQKQPIVDVVKRDTPEENFIKKAVIELAKSKSKRFNELITC